MQKRLSATNGLRQSKQFAIFNEEDLFCDYKSGRVLVNAFIESIEIDDSNDEIIINFK